MATIPANVILIWTGTHASIPTGWSRETTLDDKFPKAWGAQNPNVTGGSNTHTHTGGHTHTLVAHHHTYTMANCSESYAINANDPQAVSSGHNHSSSSTTSVTNGSLQSNGSWSSVNQEPPYYTVIFIKPTGTVAALPAGICAHYYGSSAPILWNFCDGANSTPDLRNKYLKGASAGANAGTTGGGTTHVHTVTHGHTADAHYHTGTSPASSDQNRGREQGGGAVYTHKNHTHVVTSSSVVDTVSNYTKTDAGSGDTVEVAYKKLGVIKATVGSARKGMVGLWLGSTASVPINWVLCDGNNGTYDLRDKFVKIGAALANNNETGGANTHTHTAVSHSHTTTGAHTHTMSHGAPSATAQIGGGSGGGIVSTNHTHAFSGINSVSATYSTDNISASTVDNQPAYLTAAYIQLNKVNPGGSFLFSMVNL